MKIVLDNVILRRPEPRDIDNLYEMRNDSEVISLLGGFSMGFSMKDITDWIEYHRNQRDEIIWIIADKNDDKCIGHSGLYKIDHRVRSAEFAILIGDKDHRFKGIGKQVSCAAIEYGFKQLNLHRVYLSVLSSNAGAVELYKKLGFRTEGTLRHDQFRDGHYLDVIIMGMLEDEWATSNCRGK